MEQETVDLLKFGAFMTVLAVLLVYVIQSVLLGKQVNSQAVTKLTEIHVDTEDGRLKDLKDEEIRLPSATVLALLEYNYKVIDSVTCYVCNIAGSAMSESESFCLKNHLKGNVSLFVRYDSGMGLYNIIIKE